MGARRSAEAVVWCMIAGIAAASCGRQGEPKSIVEGDPTGAAVSVKLPRDPVEAAGYVADFGYVLVGARGVVAMEIRNGGGEEIVFEGAAVEAPFDTDLPDRFSLTPGGATVAELGFEPAVEGAASAELVLTARAGGESTEIRIRLGGQGIAPYLACDPAELDFGEVRVGAAKELGFRCTNELDVPVSVVVETADESVILALDVTPSAGAGDPIVVMPHGVLEGRVTYRPSEAGRLVGSLILHGPDGPVLATIGIQALGVEDEPPGDECIEFTPPRVHFDNCDGLKIFTVGFRSTCDDFEIDAIEIIESPHGHAFPITSRPQLPLTLSAGDFERISLSFAPAEGDPRELAGEIGVWSGANVYKHPITGIAAKTHVDSFFIDEGLSPLLLTASPEDANGDGEIDERDFFVYIHAQPVDPVDEIGTRHWSYDQEANAIVLGFNAPYEPGTVVMVDFKVPCTAR